MRRVVDSIPEGVWLFILPAAVFAAGYLLIIGVCAL